MGRNRSIILRDIKWFNKISNYNSVESHKKFLKNHKQNLLKI
jgi:hypothetical protein